MGTALWDLVAWSLDGHSQKVSAEFGPNRPLDSVLLWRAHPTQKCPQRP